jgi:hypothetical protein
MPSLDIARRRLDNQRLARARFKTPGEVVQWFGAMQAQDYLGALWAVGLRMRAAGEASVEKALADRTIIRTYPMRGTLHFVAAPDARWMLKLLASRAVARNASRLRQQFGVDAAVVARSRDVLQKTLEGGRLLTRDGMYKALMSAGIPTANQRGLHILGWLVHEAFLCFGPRMGKQQTFVLLDEWVPPTGERSMSRDEALAELARRYFTSHGPATALDFAWWSGLAVADARAGLESVRSHFECQQVDGQTYWFTPSPRASHTTAPRAYLLPAFDEYLVSYKDRAAALEALHEQKVKPSSAEILGPTIVLDGQVIGTWKRTLKNGSLTVTPHPFIKIARADAPALFEAAERYSAFLGLPVAFQAR